MFYHSKFFCCVYGRHACQRGMQTHPLFSIPVLLNLYIQLGMLAITRPRLITNFAVVAPGTNVRSFVRMLTTSVFKSANPSLRVFQGRCHGLGYPCIVSRRANNLPVCSSYTSAGECRLPLLDLQLSRRQDDFPASAAYWRWGWIVR